MGQGWLQGISPVDTLADTPIASLSHQRSSAQMHCLMHAKQGQELATLAGCNDKVALTG